jgi:HEAT repeat protein
MTNPRTNPALAAAALLAAGATSALADDEKPTAKEQEAKALATLKNAGASRKDRSDACRVLAHAGGKDSIAPLAALLTDDEMSHMARYGLETNPDPAVDEALRDALGKAKGRTQAGIIGSIGVRKDEKAVEALGKCLGDSDTEVAQAAARALGKIGTTRAARVLHSKLADASGSCARAIDEGLFRCAEQLACGGNKDAALAIYKGIGESASAPKHIKDAAASGAKRIQ